MTVGRTNHVLSHLHSLAFRQERRGLTDAQLLERFLARREEVAFEELVRRHGPMVLGVCRRILGEPHDAADAFQATFLVLVRRAASIVPRSRVGPWLYGVARRTALKARSAAIRRLLAERKAACDRPHTTPADSGEDLRPLLDEELGRLPEKYRAPLVLCLLEARSRKEAAGLLGWSEGTLSGRLARAKGLLCARLRRRGLALAGGALLAAVEESAVAAQVPASLAGMTMKAASHPGFAAAHVSAPVLSLMEEVMKAMLTSKLRAIAGMLVLAAGIGLGTAAVTGRDGPPAQSDARSEATTVSKAAAPPGKTPTTRPAAHVIEPSDTVLLVYALGGDDPVQVDLLLRVRPDGTVDLGSLGSVSVSGQTVVQARREIGRHLARRLDRFDPVKLTVDVIPSKSKVIFGIVKDSGDCQVHHFLAIGNEAVMDLIPRMRVKLASLGQKRICIRRRSDDGKSRVVLKVDWKAISEQGSGMTNYQLQPGDILEISSPLQPHDAGKGMVSDSVRELEGILKALREASSQEEQRRVVERLDRLTKKLREQLKDREQAR